MFQCNASHLSKVHSGLLEPTDLQSLFEQVEGVCEGFTDDSGYAATHKALQPTCREQDTPLSLLIHFIRNQYRLRVTYKCYIFVSQRRTNIDQCL